jgi:aquaporin Z
MSSSNIWKKIGIGAAVAGGVIAGVALIPITLGFGGAGIVAGSVAAGIQAAIGNVAAGSVFAICTSLGMTGVFASSAAVGAILGAGILYLLLVNTQLGTEALGTNGFGEASATNITLIGAIVTEIILTFVFVYTILGVTGDESKSNVAGLVIGLTLTFVHLLGIKLTGTSVNPARSFGPALFAGATALKQVWVFIIAPLCGSACAAVTYKFLNKETK